MKDRISYIFIMVSWLFVLISCVKKTSNVELKQAEVFMEIYPDSALQLLTQITEPEGLSEAEYANYCLLYTQALDKNRLPLTSDSLIEIAVRYFETSSDSSKKATAYFYMGRVNQLMSNYKEALKYYQLALDAADTKSQYNLLTLIYNNMGTLYVYQKLYDLALTSQQKSYEYACIQGNTKYYPFLLRDIGRAYLLNKQADSALVYYNNALSVACEISDLQSQTSIQNELALLYDDLELYPDAMNCINNSITFGVNKDRREHAYMIKGNIYLKMNQYDSARIFLNKSALSNNIHLRVAAYDCLYRLEQKLGNYKNAIDVNNLFLQSKDSTYSIEKSKAIAEIQYKYDHERVEKEMIQLKLAQQEKDVFNYRLFSIIFLGLIAIAFGALWKYKEKKNELRKKGNREKQHEEYLRLSYIKIVETEAALHEKEYLFIQKEKELHDNQLTLSENEVLLTQREDEINNIKDEVREQKEKIVFLRRHERQFRDDYFEKTAIYKRVMNNKSGLIKGSLTEDDLTELMDETDKQFDGFTLRLKTTYPLLTKSDLCFCCLFRLKLTAPEISKLFCITVDAVNKRKQRIKVTKMNEEKNELAFNDFLRQF